MSTLKILDPTINLVPENSRITRAAVRGERVSPDVKMRERHVQHRPVRSLLAGDVGERFQTRITLQHIRLRFSKGSLPRDRELHDPGAKLRDEFPTFDQRSLLHEVIPPTDGPGAGDGVEGSGFGGLQRGERKQH